MNTRIPAKAFKLLSILRGEKPPEVRRLIGCVTQVLDDERTGKVRCSFCSAPMTMTRRSKKYCTHKCQTAAAMRRMRAKKRKLEEGK